MKKVVLGLVLAAASVEVFAQDTGIYGEVLLGNAEQEAKVEGYPSLSGDDLSFGVRGGFNFNSNFALEIAYQNYGEAEESYIDEVGNDINDKFGASAFGAGVKASIPFENGFSISARLGLSLWDIDIDETDSSAPGEVFSLEEDGNDFYYGIGAQFNVSSNFHVGAEYTITELDVSIGDASFDHEIRNVGVFVGYRF